MHAVGQGEADRQLGGRRDGGRTLSSLIEAALREFLVQVHRKRRGYTLQWVVVEGGVQPGVDLTDRDALLDRMEGRS